MTHIIECSICHAREYLETVPEVWFCKHLKAEKNKKFWICGNCYRGHWIENIEMFPKCSDCEQARSVQILGTITDLKPMKDEIVHEPSIAELSKKLKMEIESK